jgi:hypothetical protein
LERTITEIFELKTDLSNGPRFLDRLISGILGIETLLIKPPRAA